MFGIKFTIITEQYDEYYDHEINEEILSPLPDEIIFRSAFFLNNNKIFVKDTRSNTNIKFAKVETRRTGISFRTLEQMHWGKDLYRTDYDDNEMVKI